MVDVPPGAVPFARAIRQNQAVHQRGEYEEIPKPKAPMQSRTYVLEQGIFNSLFWQRGFETPFVCISQRAGSLYYLHDTHVFEVIIFLILLRLLLSLDHGAGSKRKAGLLVYLSDRSQWRTSVVDRKNLKLNKNLWTLHAWHFTLLKSVHFMHSLCMKSSLSTLWQGDLTALGRNAWWISPSWLVSQWPFNYNVKETLMVG